MSEVVLKALTAQIHSSNVSTATLNAPTAKILPLSVQLAISPTNF